MNHYQVLEVDPRAPVEEIQHAYHRMARQWHPDANAHPDAGRVMAALNEAWAVLGHPDRRRRYDREIGVAAPDGDARETPPWEDESASPMPPDVRPGTVYDALATLPVLFVAGAFVCFVFGGLMASRMVLALSLGLVVLGGLGFIAAFVMAAGRPALPTPRLRRKRPSG